MRLLQEDDLRWVAGGLCKHGLYTSSEYWDIESNYYAAESAYNCAVTVLFDLDPNNPAQAAAYAAAEAQYESASDWYSSASNDYGYMEVCTDPMCDEGGNWGGQTPPPPTYYSTGGGSGNSSGDNFLTNAVSAVADFLGFDGSVGYDGPEDRQWVWQPAVDYVHNAWDALTETMRSTFGSLINYAASIWNYVTDFTEELEDVVVGTGSQATTSPGYTGTIPTITTTVSGPQPTGVNMQDLRTLAMNTANTIDLQPDQSNEYGRLIYRDTAGVLHEAPLHYGNNGTVSLTSAGIPAGAVVVAWIHSHPDNTGLNQMFPSSPAVVLPGAKNDWDSADALVALVRPTFTVDPNLVTYIYDMHTKSVFEYDIADRDEVTLGERIGVVSPENNINN